MRAGESVEEHKSVIMHLLSQVSPSSPLCSLVLPARSHMCIRLWHLSVCVESRWSSGWTSPRSSFRLSFWKGGRCSKCTPTSSHIPVSFSRKSPLYSCFFFLRKFTCTYFKFVRPLFCQGVRDTRDLHYFTAFFILRYEAHFQNFCWVPNLVDKAGLSYKTISVMHCLCGSEARDRKLCVVWS